MPKNIEHEYRNGGDDSVKPRVCIADNGDVCIQADGDIDCDGSPNYAKLDPEWGQAETSLRRSNGWKGEYQYCDSEIIPYFVLPLDFADLTDIPFKLGDVAYITYNGYSCYAIYADQGPKELIGEVSVCLAKMLGFTNMFNEKGEVVRGIPHGVTYRIKPTSALLEKTRDFRSIQEHGENVFGLKANPAMKIEPKKEVDWYEWYRLETNKVAHPGLVAWACDRVIVAKEGAKFSDFEHIFDTYGDHNVHVAPANKPWPGRIDPPKPEPKPDPKKPELWIPGADTSIKATNMQGNYRKGFPEGAIIHFTAGNDDPRGTANYLADKFPCLVMGRGGEIIQMFPLNKWAYHSATPEQEFCVGIEICASGRVEKVSNGFKTWYNRILPADRVRWVDDKDNIQAGYYDKYSEEQEAALIKLLLWLKAQAPNVFDFDRVYGHDTVCDMHGQHGRKNDPGGALSMTIPELQRLLKKKYAEITK